MKSLQPGQTFLISRPRVDCPHLWIVLSDFSRNEGSGVLIDLSTKPIPGDLQGHCILQKGEHPWITKPSYARFDDPLFLGPQQVRILLNASPKTVLQEVPLSDSVLQRILTAARKSKHLDKFRKYI